MTPPSPEPCTLPPPPPFPPARDSGPRGTRHAVQRSSGALKTPPIRHGTDRTAQSIADHGRVAARRGGSPSRRYGGAPVRGTGRPVAPGKAIRDDARLGQAAERAHSRRDDGLRRPGCRAVPGEDPRGERPAGHPGRARRRGQDAAGPAPPPPRRPPSTSTECAFVELSGPGNDPELLPRAVCEALGLPERTTGPQVDTLAEYVAERELLLVLDTCEPVLDACAMLAALLLPQAPRLTVLTTSHQPRCPPGGHPLPVPPPRRCPARARTARVRW